MSRLFDSGPPRLHLAPCRAGHGILVARVRRDYSAATVSSRTLSQGRFSYRRRRASAACSRPLALCTRMHSSPAHM